MITLEQLKTDIKKIEVEIKELKKELRQDHSTISNPSGKQYALFMLRGKVRAHYLIAAFFRGQSYSQVESPKVKYEYKIDYAIWEAKKLLETPENCEVFMQWLQADKAVAKAA